MRTSFRVVISLVCGVAAVSSAAQAKTLGEVCSRMPISMMQVECMALGAGAQFSPRALDACARITDNQSNFGLYACVVAIRDRSYSDSEVSSCDNLADVAATLSCFRSLGRKLNGGGNGRGSISLYAIRADVESSLNFLYRGDNYGARSQLELLSRKLSAGDYGRCE